ncbi:anthranilate phosphoribosyltransferase [Liquorilactobacillus vini]|uniref:Anthranilate phosphoribosyltransferase n=1 Tax=Liquorilactobacillus vini DSM 20605 TaxID=1133569 RepID=A0A0R2CCP3_9LACO|nr:anthranilate phosphoribosyltransferase [Liquorilactobacillus vini]KRM89566.1 anthranilate phosphoribosyltransferase [Liquorilactobacillus vini DSM 20605]
MIKEAIQQAVTGKNLSYETVAKAINEIMSGKASDIQIAAFLTALTAKGETIDEIAGAAAAMRQHALPFATKHQSTLEIVGTGGDQAHTFNISTTSAFIIAAAGIPVTKHGNRAASSLSGAADVLEALGANINTSPENSARILDEIGICFLFAQEYHQAMRYVAPARKELAFRTIFNILGPLANPAAAKMQLLGVYDDQLLETLPTVLQKLGVTAGMVFHGTDGLDEITLTGPTNVVEFRGNHQQQYQLTPEEFGLHRCQPAELIGGTPQENAQITREILSGKLGPKRDVVLLNSAAAIHVAQPELALMPAFEKAQRILDSGQALAKLTEFVKLTNSDVNVA